MAACRRGRTIYIDSPGTYYGILEKDVSFTVCYVHLYTDGKCEARVTIYGGQEPKADRLVFDSGVIAGEDNQCDWGRGRSEETAPDSDEGCSVVLSGEGARCMIHRI